MMRRNEGPDLEHDLVAVVEDERARVAVPPRAVAIEADGAAEAEQARGPEGQAPDPEEIAEPRRAGEADDARRLSRPQSRAAAGFADADPRRDDHDAPVREELEMDP